MIKHRRSKPAWMIVLRWLPLHLVIGAALALAAAVLYRAPRVQFNMLLIGGGGGGRDWTMIVAREVNGDIAEVSALGPVRTWPQVWDEFVATTGTRLDPSITVPAWAPRPREEIPDVAPGVYGTLTDSRVRRGWPLRCLTGGRRQNLVSTDPRVLGPYHLTTWRGLDVPTGVLPMGMIADVLIWSLPTALSHLLLLVAGRAWVRRVRRRAGGCIACGYSRAGLGPDVACPECGAVAR